MNRLELIQKRDKCWNNVEFLRSLKEQTKDKEKSISYTKMVDREKFKYKIYNTLMKQK